MGKTLVKTPWSNEQFRGEGNPVRLKPFCFNSLFNITDSLRLTCETALQAPPGRCPPLTLDACVAWKIQDVLHK